MKKSGSLRIKGTDIQVDRGRLAVFDLNLGNMETVEELEVAHA